MSPNSSANWDGESLVYGLQRLVAFFQQVTLQSLVALFPVPGTAAGRPEAFHDVNQGLKFAEIALGQDIGWACFCAHAGIIEGQCRLLNQTGEC